jgi:hypothetical protein
MQVFVMRVNHPRTRAPARARARVLRLWLCYALTALGAYFVAFP